MKKILIEDINNNLAEVFPGTSIDKICKVSFRQENKIGINVIRSTRFLCTVNVVDIHENPSKATIFIKSRGNISDEYRNMIFLWDQHYFNQKKYVIPKPLFIDRENCCLFLEYFCGDNFIHLLYKNILSGKKHLSSFIENHISKSAHWLVDFQNIHSSMCKQDIPEEIGCCETKIHEFSSLQSKEKKRLIEKVNTVVKCLPQFGETYVHDQYLFRNIIYDGDKICVVDFPHLRIGWSLYDFFTFYVGIERLQQYPLVTKSMCDNMKENFALHYFQGIGVAYDKYMLENLWALFVIITLKKRYKTSNSVKGLLNGCFIRQTLDKLIDWSQK